MNFDDLNEDTCSLLLFHSFKSLCIKLGSAKCLISYHYQVQYTYFRRQHHLGDLDKINIYPNLLPRLE
jgi:hypothetical protein